MSRCVIFDSHHPKHYLAIRELGRRCRAAGIEVVWTARDKDVLLDLMRADGEEPVALTTARKGLFNLMGELIKYDFALAKTVRKYKPMALLGNTVSIAHVGRLLGVPAIVINDDDASANPQYPKLAYPFAKRIVTLECMNEDYGAKHTTFPGIFELAYLHPDVFTPDPGIKAELGMAPDERLFLIRTVALNASHDVGAKGLPGDLLRTAIAMMEKHGRVFISSEGSRTDELSRYTLPLPPARMHHVLAATDVLLCDSQTMASEAAVLGTASLRVNSFVGKLAYLEMLEHRFGLTHGVLPGNSEQVVRLLEGMLVNRSLKQDYQARREKMLKELVSPTETFWKTLNEFIE